MSMRSNSVSELSKNRVFGAISQWVIELVLHMADPSLIPITPLGPLSPARSNIGGMRIGLRGYLLDDGRGAGWTSKEALVGQASVDFSRLGHERSLETLGRLELVEYGRCMEE